MPKLAFISNYYNYPERVLAQIAYWESLPDQFLSQVEFILVDDCSEQPTLFPPTRLNLRVFRVTTDLMWNQAGARNLGAFHAKAPWILYADIDQRFYLEPMEFLLSVLDKFDPQVMFYPQSKNITDIDGTPSSIHVNTILVNTQNFREKGMYDEDFVGHYGYEDLFLPQVWERQGGRRAILSDVDYFEDLRFATKNLNRDLARNLALATQKLEAGAKNSPGILRFAWEAVPLQVSHSTLPQAPSVSAA